MGAFDIESLLSEVSPEARCGPDISQESEFFELAAMVRPKPPGAVETDEEAQVVEPNWKEIRQRAFAVLQKSRHLEAALYFALALLGTEGMAGLRDGLYLIRGLLEHFWEDLHPQLDPEDDNDPTERMNILLPLSSEPMSEWDPVRFRSRVVRLPLCNSRRMGAFSLRDVQVARGEVTVPDADGSTPQMPIIQAAFRETPADELESTVLGVRQAVEHLEGIRKAFAERTADGSSPELSDIRGDLEKIGRVLGEYVGTDSTAGEVTAGEATDGAVAQTQPTSMTGTGEIRSRNDALAAIERACRYFERHEPSSPVPLLLRRAQRLAPKTFIEIIEDVCPGAIDQVTAVSGTAGDSPDGAEADSG